MTHKELFGVLFRIGRVRQSNWETVCKIVDLIEQRKASASGRWYESYKVKNPDWYPLALGDINTWSSMDGCRELTFRVERIKFEDTLICEAKIFDGDGRGWATNERFAAIITLPEEFIEHIGGDINAAFNRQVSNEYDDYLAETRKQWMIERKRQILETL